MRIRHATKSTFPDPPFRKVQDQGGKPNCAKFFRFWQQVAGTRQQPDERADLIKVRIYRHWPIIDTALIKPGSKSSSLFEEITGPCWFDDPEGYREAFRDRYGSGDWHLVMNEEGVYGHIIEAYFAAQDDWETYPPKLDLRTLVVGVADNKHYLKWLARNNIPTPWENPEQTALAQQEEDNMAGETVQILADTLKETSRQAIEANNRAAESRIDVERVKLTSERSADAPVRDAVAQSIQLVTGTAQEMVKMVTAHAGANYDPVQILKTAADLFKGDSRNTEILDLIRENNSRALEMQREHLEFMRTVVGMRKNDQGAYVIDRQAQTSAEESSPFASLQGLVENVEAVEKFAKVFGWSRNGAAAAVQPAAPPPPPPGKGLSVTIAENIVPICTAVTGILAMAANLFYNMKLKPGEAPRNPAEDMARAQAMNPVAAATVTTDTSAAEDTRRKQAAEAEWEEFWKQITPAFLDHFYGETTSGYTFAEWVLSNGTGQGATAEGRRQYVGIRDQIRRPQFEQRLRGHFPLWSKVSGVQPKLKEFLDQFFGYDQRGAAAA